MSQLRQFIGSLPSNSNESVNANAGTAPPPTANADAGAVPASAGNNNFGVAVGNQAAQTNPQPNSILDDDFKKYYQIALQGASGQIDDPKKAAELAAQIAKKCHEYLAQKFKAGDQKNEVWRNVLWPNFLESFANALQGTASHFNTAEKIVNAAGAEADASAVEYAKEHQELFTHTQHFWKHASLPMAMDADCKIQPGVSEKFITQIGGPKNHALCMQHEHVVDTNAHMVIAHNLEEYNQKFLPK
jgi:hypothetical protein